MALNKWSILDHHGPAHWWVGRDGTACGRDFRTDLQHAYDDDRRCLKCVAFLAATEQED